MRIRIETEKPYDAVIGRGLMDKAGELIAPLKPDRVCVVTEHRVRGLYADRVARSLKAAGIPCHVFSFPPGEENKTPENFIRAEMYFARHGLTRDSLVLALGGGVAGDLGGFAAACYQRGVSFVQMPTTVLAAVDASVGGKTGVDLPGYKNMVGAFLQPAMVIIDPLAFRTLSESQWRDGAAESVKHGLVGDEPLFEAMLRPWRERAEEIIARNIRVKAAFVKGDERDSGRRQLLNFGHTVGHAVESLSGWRISHGQSVAIGMLAETRAAWRMGFGAVMPDTVAAALKACGLETRCPFDPDAVYAAALGDKKHRSGQVTVCALRCLGEGFLQTIPEKDLAVFIRAGLNP